MEYHELLNKKSEEIQSHPKSLPPEETYEENSFSKINDKLMK